MPQITNTLIWGAKGLVYSIITPMQLKSKCPMNLLKLYLKLSSEALVRQDLQGPGNVKGARDHSFLHVPEH